MAQHSSVGPSGAHRWMHCTASVGAEANYKTETGINFYADEGSAAHAVMDRCLRGGNDAEFYLDEWYDPKLGQFSSKSKHASFIHVDEEMVEGVQTYLDYIANIIKGKKHKQFVEHTVDLSSVHPDMFGTCDTAVYLFETYELYVIDFKYGAGYAVDVEYNPQTMSYGTGMLIEISKKYPIKKVHNVIVQPRAHHVQGPIRRWECEPYDLIEFAGDLAKAAKEALGPSPKFKAGQWCKFCNHLANCEEAKKNALKMAAVIFDDEDKVEIGSLLNDTYVVEEWIRAVRAAAHVMLRRGDPPEGWEIGQGKSHRKWAHSVNATEKALLKQGLSKKDIYTEPKLHSPAQIQKMLRNIPKKERETFIEKLVMRPPGSPVLVRAGKGRAFTDASAVFDDEENLL